MPPAGRTSDSGINSPMVKAQKSYLDEISFINDNILKLSETKNGEVSSSIKPEFPAHLVVIIKKLHSDEVARKWYHHEVFHSWSRFLPIIQFIHRQYRPTNLFIIGKARVANKNKKKKPTTREWSLLCGNPCLPAKLCHTLGLVLRWQYRVDLCW